MSREANLEDFVIVDEWYHLIPPITKEDEATLKEDIIQNGVRSDLIVTKEMEIIDGYQRHRIARQNPKAPRKLPYTIRDLPREEVPKYIFALNFQRRHLSRYNRAKIAVDTAQKWGWFEKEKKKELIENLQKSARGSKWLSGEWPSINDVICDFFGVTRYYVEAARKIQGSMDSKLMVACQDGTMKVSKAIEALDKKIKRQSVIADNILRENSVFFLPTDDTFQTFLVHWERLGQTVWSPKRGDQIKVIIKYIETKEKENPVEKPWKPRPFQEQACIHGVAGGCRKCYSDPDNLDHGKKSSVIKQDSISIPVDKSEMDGFRVLPDRDLEPCRKCNYFDENSSCIIDFEKEEVPKHCRKWRSNGRI